MHENGLELRERGNGLVVEAADGTRVKASTIARELSKPGLEARLGPFEAPPERQASAQDPAAIRQGPYPPTTGQHESNSMPATRPSSRTAYGSARRRAGESPAAQGSRRRGRQAGQPLRRATIKVVDGKGISKKVLYSQASTALRDRLAAIHKEYAKEREKLYQGFQRRAWADWLKQEALQGNAEALTALRAREAAQGLKGNTVAGVGVGGEARPCPRPGQHHQEGHDHLRAGQSAVRDDGDKLQVSREATREGVKPPCAWRWSGLATRSPSTAPPSSRRRSSGRPWIPSYPSPLPTQHWSCGGNSF
jgi:hypothetical protein